MKFTLNRCAENGFTEPRSAGDRGASRPTGGPSAKSDTAGASADRDSGSSSFFWLSIAALPIWGAATRSGNRRTRSCISGFGKRAASNRLDLLIALPAARREQLARVLRVQVRPQRTQHRQLELTVRHPRKRSRITPTHPRRRDASTCGRLAEAECLRAIREQRRVPKCQAKVSLLNLSQVREQIRKRVVFALHQRRQRRQEPIVIESAQSISVIHALWHNTLILELTRGSHSGFPAQNELRLGQRRDRLDKPKNTRLRDRNPAPLASRALPSRKSCPENSSQPFRLAIKTTAYDFVVFATPSSPYPPRSLERGHHEIVRTASCDPLARRTNIPSASAPRRLAELRRSIVAAHAQRTLP